VTLVIEDFICIMFFILHVLILLTNLLTTHNLKMLTDPVFCVLLIFPFILFIVPKLRFSKYRRDVERYGSCHSGEIRMDSMSRHQASFYKPVSFYIQMF
jgi:membrane protein YdbS with pleckstrin-like domain